MAIDFLSLPSVVMMNIIRHVNADDYLQLKLTHTKIAEHMPDRAIDVVRKTESQPTQHDAEQARDLVTHMALSNMRFLAYNKWLRIRMKQILHRLEFNLGKDRPRRGKPELLCSRCLHFLPRQTFADSQRKKSATILQPGHHAYVMGGYRTCLKCKNFYGWLDSVMIDGKKMFHCRSCDKMLPFEQQRTDKRSTKIARRLVRNTVCKTCEGD